MTSFEVKHFHKLPKQIKAANARETSETRRARQRDEEACAGSERYFLF